MLKDQSHDVSYAEAADEAPPPSIRSEATSASADDSNVLVTFEDPPPRVTFADRVRISSGVHIGTRGLSTPTQNSRGRSKPNRDSPRERILYVAEHASSFTEGIGMSPSPSRSRSSSLSDSASSMSVPLRPPSLVTPHAWAKSYNIRTPNRASGASLSTVITSSDATDFLAGLRGSIKKPQKQHAARPVGLDADLAASTQPNPDDVENVSVSGPESEESEEPNETTPLRTGTPSSRRNRQTLRSVARSYGQSGNEAGVDGDGDGRWFECISLQVRLSFSSFLRLFLLAVRVLKGLSLSNS